MAKTPGIFVAITVLSFLGFFFQAAGLALPWWFVINDIVYIGVWYLAYCWGGNIGSGNCSTITLNAADQATQPGSEVALQWFYVIFQACATAAVGIVLLCTLGLLFGVCCSLKNKCAYVFCCVNLFLSGLLVCPALAFFGLAYIYLGSYFLKTMSATTFPYAALASGLGCFITFVTGITLAIALCSWNTYMSEDNYDDSHGMPMTQSGNTEGYNQGYNQGGYNQGYDQGGYNQGYDQGGHTQGYGNKAYQGQGYEKRAQQPQYSQPKMYRPVASPRY
ncbi:uncharacterized protein LOC132551878 [Ylistrum balloti]|uniref:uncharacterized protein LOC132551878 n=1 Tax=Ylistrum balloti TaxID=509963 RepID=UPI0029058A00|nr:uncharacterized protein LOC132551878 [Ylistrum balloti]